MIKPNPQPTDRPQTTRLDCASRTECLTVAISWCAPARRDPPHLDCRQCQAYGPERDPEQVAWDVEKLAGIAIALERGLRLTVGGNGRRDS